jgi:hypothetical protein
MSEKCDKLHRWFNRRKRHDFPFDEKDIPFNGIYVLFENGELAHGTDRIVRIGTHTGDKQLRSRLKQHFIKENKDRSIFRKNIGRALLNRDKDAFLEEWELDLTSRKAKDKYGDLIDLEKQKEIEKRTTECIQRNFSFVVFQVPNKEQRLEIESKIISTVSLCDECKPSPDWLGLFSTKRKIRESGLWLVNELYKDPLSENDIRILGESLEPG